MKKNALAKAIEWFVAFFEPLPPDARRKIVYQPKNSPAKDESVWPKDFDAKDVIKALDKQAPKPKGNHNMPLVKSAKPAAFKKNIATSVKEGKPIKQSVAIAYSEARAAKKSSTKGKK